MKFNLKNIPSFIFSLPIIKQFLAWIKVNSFPGFLNVPIYDVIVFIINELRRQALVIRANAIAFSFFLSIFPLMLSIVTLFPYLEKYLLAYLPIGKDFNSVFKTLGNQFEGIIPAGVFDTLLDVATNPRAGLLSFGFILAIFFASNGMMTIMRSFEKSYPRTFKNRNALKKRITAIFLTGLLGFMVLASVLLVILGGTLIEYLFGLVEADQFTTVSVNVLRWLLIIILFYVGISLIYRYGASTIEKFQFWSPGATLATLLSLLSSLVFSFYVENFDTYNKLYGSIGTIIVIMLWIQINSFIILIGFELNASIAVNRDLKAAKKEDI